MCAVFGFLDYKGKTSNAVLKKLIHYLSVAAEVRGTDATGIAYVRDGSMVTYKKPKPSHKVKLFFPRGTRSVIGHTRFTTQGSEKRNCNNHPFEGHCGTEAFALAHNGVLYNDRELRRNSISQRHRSKPTATSPCSFWNRGSSWTRKTSNAWQDLWRAALSLRF